MIMKKNILFLILLFSSFSLFASRLPPPKIENITLNNYEYSASDEFSFFFRKVIIVKTNLKTNESEKIKIYTVFYNIFKETDVQDIFIKRMELKNNFEIEIQNEKNEIFILDTTTNKVKKIK